MIKEGKRTEERIKNVFLTGPPSSGKTTVIKKVLAKLQRKATGFHTEEIKKNTKRVGFLMKTLDGKEGLLGHEEIKSRFHIRRYGVSIENIENLPEDSTIIISAHGVSDKIKNELKEKNFKIIDSTCPLVENVHKITKEEKKEG